jgi:hypothetical protein
MLIKWNHRYLDEAGDEGSMDGASAAQEPTQEPVQEKSTTLMDNKADDLSPQDKGTWPEDWRKEFAGDDEKAIKRFERYASPRDVANALLAAQNKIRSGELTTKLSDNPSDDELAEWRKDNGIPEKADAYEVSIGEGVVIGDEDKPLVDAFLKRAHDSNMTNDQANAALGTYFEMKQQEMEARNDADHQAQLSGEDELRAEWGNEFRRNINVLHGHLDSIMDQETKDAMLNGRLADGTPIGSSPLILKALLNTALQINPSGTIVPAGGGDLGQGINDEIASIEKTMRENRQEYNNNAGMQERYRQLLSAKEKMQ